MTQHVEQGTQQDSMPELKSEPFVLIIRGKPKLEEEMDPDPGRKGKGTLEPIPSNNHIPPRVYRSRT